MRNFEKFIIILSIICFCIFVIKFSQPIPIKTEPDKIEEKIKKIINNNEKIFIKWTKTC